MSITLTAGQLLLLGMLTDKLITLATTISQVSGMTEEEVKAKTVEEESLSDFLLQQIKEG